MLERFSRLTYDATLAELTSLEEMMRIMMDEGYVHQDIISKLWQIYGRSYAYDSAWYLINAQQVPRDSYPNLSGEELLLSWGCWR
jgi:hypothetical protein